MIRKRYSSDLREQDWEHIKHLVFASCTSKRPLLEIVNGILYWLKNDCIWQDLPGDFPPWYTVRYYFKKWEENGTWQHVITYLAKGRTMNVLSRKRKKKASSNVIINLDWMKYKAASILCK